MLSPRPDAYCENEEALVLGQLVIMSYLARTELYYFSASIFTCKYYHTYFGILLFFWECSLG